MRQTSKHLRVTQVCTSVIILLVLLLPMQSFGEARCKVDGKWYPYTDSKCKFNAKSDHKFVLFKIQGGEFSPCIRLVVEDDIDDLQLALKTASAVTGLSNCRAFSEDGFMSALCEDEDSANVLFAPDMQTCEQLRSDYQKALGKK